MKKPLFLSRVLMFIVLTGSCLFSVAQSSTDVKVFHHWHNLNAGIKLSSVTEGEYMNLPQTDYTPQQNIGEWAAAGKIKDFANGITGKLSVIYILSVDETGIVRKLKTVKTNDQKNASLLSAIILNTKISGPSFTHNEPVASYVPCSISIDKNQITVL